MVDILLFTPKKTLTARENLKAFIRLCREELTVFGEDLDWEAPVWPKVAVFAKLGVKTRKPKPHEIMDDAFIDFAKAYFRYQQGHKPTQAKSDLKALKALEAALLQVTGSASVEGISIAVLDQAAQLAKAHYSVGAAYHCGRELSRLARFVSDHRLVGGAVHDWKSPIRRPDDKNKTGKHGQAVRDSKLPDEIALNAMAEIFANDPYDPRDVFTSSVFAMLMCAPSRISEVLALPVDCEVVEKDRKGVERYGWRFYAGKGYEGDIKWIPTPMVSVAKEAVRRLKGLSENARAFAKWAEEHDDEFFPHPDCPDVDQDCPLSIHQVAQALGLKSDTRLAAYQSLVSRGLATEDGVYSLRKLWRYVQARLPDDFPWFDKGKGVKYSQALVVLNKNQLSRQRTTIPVELQKPNANLFNNDLQPREHLGPGNNHKSIFDRHGYRTPSGERLKMTSHQVRHLLNTMAQRGGLSNLEIAKWSGRASVKQNRVYNHMTDEELVGLAERIDPSAGLFGPLEKVERYQPISTVEFNGLARGAAHVTEYGYCVHDYTMSPCEKYRDCLNCTEHVCIKGDTANLERIKVRLERVERLHAEASKAVQRGEMGADRWFQYHEKTLQRLRELVNILENPELEDGTYVKLAGNDFSLVKRVMRKKEIEHAGERARHIAKVERIEKILGGGFGEASD